MISRKTHERVANILYWKEHYAPITNISRLFSDITKHGHEHQICLRCLGHLQTEETFARHKQLCTRDDVLSVLYVLPTLCSKQAQIKFNQYKYCTKAPFVIYADFEYIYLYIYIKATRPPGKADDLHPATQCAQQLQSLPRVFIILTNGPQ